MYVVHLLAPRVIYEYVKLFNGVILQNFKNQILGVMCHVLKSRWFYRTLTIIRVFL